MECFLRNKSAAEAILMWYSRFGVDCSSLSLSIYNTLLNDGKQSENRPQKRNAEENIVKIHFHTLSELKEFILNSDFCFIKKTAKNTVFSDGNEDSDIMIIGEAPGAEEDEQGKPFVGQSGKLLDNMLSSVGINRRDVYISNVLFWRPPGNRTPSSDEIASCMPYVREHIRLISPKVILLTGGVAAKSILNTNESISELRGKINKYMIEDKSIDVIATFHPAYLLRSPAQKAKSFLDLIKLRKHLRG